LFIAWAFIKTNCKPILQVLVYCGSMINVYCRGQKQRRALKLQECVWHYTCFLLFDHEVLCSDRLLH